MSQMSYFWTTNGAGAGDQVASYTQAQLAIAHAIIAACSRFEGVAPGYLNELACTDGGDNTLSVNTGGAMVDGIPYSNSASVDVTIPSAVGAGNTRIDRVVVRVSWAGYDAVITRVAGTDAATPSAPAITQTTGTTYDILLCQVLVDTAGALTVTDERTWAAAVANGIGADAVTGAKIADDSIDSEHYVGGSIDLAHMSANSVDSDQYVDGSIDTAHLANDAVDDTKVGARVPQFYRRQGGDASDWSTGGTTDYTPTTIRMQGGTLAFGSLIAGQTSTTGITFPVAFSNAPIVVVGRAAAGGSENPGFVRALSVTAAGFSLAATNSGGTTSDITAIWLAIGPE